MKGRIKSSHVKWHKDDCHAIGIRCMQFFRSRNFPWKDMLHYLEYFSIKIFAHRKNIEI